MVSRSAKVKLKAILVIDLIIVAIASGVFLYLYNTGQLIVAPKEAEFEVTDLIISPLEVEIGENVTISANVTNIGEIDGSYMLNLTVNDALKENQTVLLTSGASKIVELSANETSEGSYTVKVGNLSAVFNVKAPAPTTSSIVLSKLFIRPYEVNVGSPVNIKFNARNPNTTSDRLSVRITVDGAVIGTETVELDAGDETEVEFEYISTTEGSHRVKANTLSGSFRTVPEGMHTLSVLISPTPKEGGTEFTINGEEFTTPYSALLPEGTYTIAMPSTDPSGQYGFLNWENKNTNPKRTIQLNSAKILVGYWEHGTSCPSLFTWNGTDYVYVAEVSNHGWLGYMNYVTNDPDWPIAYWRNHPWDYVRLGTSQLQPQNGYYNMILTQKWNEIFYLDTTYMVVVDHPKDVNVYSTLVEQYLDPDYMGKIYTVSKTPSTPLSAFNEKGENVLAKIQAVDDVFTPGVNGAQSQSWDNMSWNRLTLDLGDLSNAEQIKLIVRGIVDWGEAEDYNNWIDKFFDPTHLPPNGTQITPPPYMEVKDAKGNWVSVPEGRQFPIPPDGLARTFVVDLTGLFLTDDYSIRINNFWNVTFDYIAVDTTEQADIITQEVYPQANLYQAFTTGSVASGNFTRYGDITPLILEADDMFAIGKQGDEVSLAFVTPDIAPPAEDMERDCFLFISLWFKDELGNWGYGFNFTVDPLPFQNMSGFPYPLDTESYPDDEMHLNYLREFNTRAVTPYTQPAPQESHFTTYALSIIMLLTIANSGVLIYFRKRDL